jgi:predicted nucleotidyltransferase
MDESSVMLVKPSIKPLDEPMLNQVVEVLTHVPGLCAAYLHGSSLSGELHTDSDVDLALLPMPGNLLKPLERLALSSELESILHRPVDLGILSIRNLVFCKEVICKGKRLFAQDRLASDLFAAHALSMYAELQQQRKEVLDAYAA